MNINCIIIDDEPLARKGLREYIADVAFLTLVGEYNTAMKALDAIDTRNVQLIFLDIQMPGVTGIDFLRSFTQAPPVIFTTAYPQFALDGYELNALDYLVKPVSFERFMKSVMKAREFYEVRQKNTTDVKETGSVNDHFFIKADNKLIKIFYSDIIFAEGLQNYVVIHTKEKKYITYLTFKSLEEYLPADMFIRTHKSYIVSASKIESIEGNELQLGHHRVPVSRNLKEEVMQKLLNGKFLKR